jgi:LysM repeat protein
MDIKKFLETVDKFDFAGEKQGQQPGQQWQGTDKGLPGTKLVGEELDSNVVLIQDPKGQYLDKLDINVAAKKYNFNANDIKQQLQHQDFTQIGNIRVIKPIAAENVIKELEDYVKETSTERKLKRDFDNFDSEDWADWDAKIKRLKQLAKQGELVTVWDKEKRVYKNVPKSEIKEYQNRMDPDAQVTSPPSPDASQTAIDQIKDKIFARDVEGETVEEQTPTTTPPAPGAQQFKFTPDQEKWLGGANRQDPDILKRMPGPKPGVDYFKGQDDQARAKTLNIGRQNLNTVKGVVGAQKDAPEVFPTRPAAAPAVAVPKPQAAAPAPTRPVVVDEPRKTALDPNAYKKVPQQTIKVDAPAATTAPAAAVQQADRPARTTWRSLAKLNPQIKNPDRIYPGQEITLPDGSKAVVDKGDTLSGIAQRYRQGGYADSTPVKTAPATATSTPVKPQPDLKGTELPKVSGKAASQLQKGREYRARQAAKQDNTNLGGNAADPEAQAFAKPDTPKAEPGVTATANLGVSQGGIAAAFGDLKKRDDGNWYFPGGVKVTNPKTIAAANKAAVQTSTRPTAIASNNARQEPTRSTAKNFKPMPSYILNQIPGVESNNNPKAVGAAGETGAWQTIAGTLKDPGYGVEPARDNSPEELARVGKDYANAMYNKYRDPEKALAAYNAGPGAVDKAIRAASMRPGSDWKDFIPKSTREQYLTKYNLQPPTRLAAKGGATVESLMSDYRKFVAEYGNQQAPDQQATSQDSAESDAEAELKRQRMDRRVSQATLAGLSAVLPPGTNTAVAATALNKIVDQKPLSPQENQVIGTLMPLLARAAEEPSTSSSLKTALGRAGMLTKLGKQ